MAFEPKIIERGDVLLAQEDEVDSAYYEKSRDSFLVFCRGLVIDSQFGAQVLETCIAKFQRDTLNDLSPSLHALRDGTMPPCRRFWIERTKKASKDADLAMIVIWLAAFATRPFYGEVGAADREQAGIVKDRVSNLLHLNPWLNEYIKLVNNEIRSTATKADGKPMATFNILAADTTGSHGSTPDLLIVNELSHITKWEFVQNLMDNADGVAQGMIILATNAGFKNTPAWQWRLNAIREKSWSVHVLDRPAPWHSRETINEAKQRNAKGRYLRLWRGIWVSGKGDAIEEDLLDACFSLLGPTDTAERGFQYLCGLDVGISQDHCGVVVLGVSVEDQIVQTAWHQRFIPPEGGKVNLMAVENALLALHQRFLFRCMFYDPHQAELMAQRLNRRFLTHPIPFTGKNLNAMASAFLQLLNSQQLKAYDDEEGSLRRDFGRFNLVEKSYGYRLEATKGIDVTGEEGHADVGTALVIALPGAIELLDGSMDWFPKEGEDIVGFGVQLSEEELEETPSELKELIDMEKDIGHETAGGGFYNDW